jgi:hypothetical protein
MRKANRSCDRQRVARQLLFKPSDPETFLDSSSASKPWCFRSALKEAE